MIDVEKRYDELLASLDAVTQQLALQVEAQQAIVRILPRAISSSIIESIAEALDRIDTRLMDLESEQSTLVKVASELEKRIQALENRRR